MIRPPNIRRVHYSLDGSIALVNKLPIEVLRTGDTASGSDPEGGLWLWRIGEIKGRRVAWERIEAWAPDRARQYVADADLFVAVLASGELAPGGGLPS